jgi:hypothetical protein
VVVSAGMPPRRLARSLEARREQLQLSALQQPHPPCARHRAWVGDILEARAFGEPLHDLEPALDVALHLQRSEYSSYSRLVERCDIGRKYRIADLYKIRSSNSRFLDEQLRDALIRCTS